MSSPAPAPAPVAVPPAFGTPRGVGPRSPRSLAPAAAAAGLTGDARGRQVFVSGGGSNLKALHRAMESGRVHGELALVVSDKPGCGGWAYAEGLGVPVAAFPADGSGAGSLDAAGLVALLREELRVDLVVLAG